MISWAQGLPASGGFSSKACPPPAGSGFQGSEAQDIAALNLEKSYQVPRDIQTKIFLALIA